MGRKLVEHEQISKEIKEDERNLWKKYKEIIKFLSILILKPIF